MKNAIKRLFGMALSLCVMAGTFAFPTAYAETAAVISEVEISGITTPVIEEHTESFVSGISVSAEAQYQIDSKNLYKADTTEAAGEKFEKDQKYDLTLVLSAKNETEAKFPETAETLELNVSAVKSISESKLTVTVEDIQAVYKITLNHNDGAEGTEPTTQKKLTDHEYKLSQSDLEITRENFTLKGWNTSSDGSGTEITAETVFDGTVSEIFAVWEAVSTVDIKIDGVTAPSYNAAPTTEGITITEGYNGEYSWIMRPVGSTDWINCDHAAYKHGFEYAINAVITPEDETAALDTAKNVSVNSSEYSVTPDNNSLTVIHAFAALNHTIEKVEKLDSTCTATGHEEHFKCECGELFKDDKGNETITLDEIEIKKKDHVAEEEWTVDKEPTTTSQGHRYKKCVNCYTVVAEEAIASLIGNVEYEFTCVHADTTTYAAYPATCTTNGHTGNVACSWCGEVMSLGSVIEATGHNYVNGICTVCGHVYGSQSSSGNIGGSSSSGGSSSGSGSWIPQTGDENQPLLYVILIAAAGAVIVAVSIFGKKRGRSKK